MRPDFKCKLCEEVASKQDENVVEIDDEYISPVCNSCTKDIAITTLKAENERLREALKKANTCNLNSDVQDIVTEALTKNRGE